MQAFETTISFRIQPNEHFVKESVQIVQSNHWIVTSTINRKDKA